MTRYLALLRGVNVGGRSVIAMSELREMFTDLGYQRVSTYIQSGNVLFDAERDAEGRVTGHIEAGIKERFGKEVAVVLRTIDELDATIAGNPYAGHEDPTKLLVAFLSATPPADRAAKLVTPAGETGEVTLRGRDVYIHVPDGYGRSKLTNTFIERALGVRCTVRNWRSITKLRDLLAAT